MSKFKGTPGKWESKELFGNFVVIDEKRNVIKINDNKANALLISKAPELLKMLENLVSRFEKLPAIGLLQNQDVERSRQLIKEATEV